MDVRNLSLPEWRYLAAGLAAQMRTLPKAGTFRPYYNATSWDHDDLYRVARADAVGSRSAVIQLVSDRRAADAWPRGRYEAKFWLRARCQEAAVWAHSLTAKAHPSDGPPRAPKDTRLVLDWLLYDFWDEKLVDYWLSENLGDYASLDTYGTSDEDHDYYEKWIARLRSGYYLRRAKI